MATSAVFGAGLGVLLLVASTASAQVASAPAALPASRNGACTRALSAAVPAACPRTAVSGARAALPGSWAALSRARAAVSGSVPAAAVRPARIRTASARLSAARPRDLSASRCRDSPPRPSAPPRSASTAARARWRTSTASVSPTARAPASGSTRCAGVNDPGIGIIAPVAFGIADARRHVHLGRERRARARSPVVDRHGPAARRSRGHGRIGAAVAAHRRHRPLAQQRAVDLPHVVHAHLPGRDGRRHRRLRVRRVVSPRSEGPRLHRERRRLGLAVRRDARGGSRRAT